MNRTLIAVYARAPVRYPALERALKLSNATKRTNMHRLDERGVVVRYDTIVDIVRAHVARRLPIVGARLLAQAAHQDKCALVHENKARFVAAWLGPDRIVYDDIADWWAALAANGFASDAVAGDGSNVDTDTDTHTFRYLTSMNIGSLTRASAARFNAAAVDARQQSAALRAATPLAVWLTELEQLRAAYTAFAAERRARNQVELVGTAAASDVRPTRKRAAPKATATGKGKVLKAV